jgi:N-acetyl-1-D-myo-inositol-2-amino-2-deoxy-alpha-D-glucopyranoside deacetylase
VTAIAARVLPLVFAFATGAATGFVLTFTHRQYLVDVVGLTVPLGLIGGLAIVAALIAGMRLAFAERAAPIAAAAGVILGSAVLVLPGNSGSLYVPDDPIGYVWAVAPTVLAIVIIGWPSRRSGEQGFADERPFPRAGG